MRTKKNKQPGNIGTELSDVIMEETPEIEQEPLKKYKICLKHNRIIQFPSGNRMMVKAGHVFTTPWPALIFEAQQKENERFFGIEEIKTIAKEG